MLFWNAVRPVSDPRNAVFDALTYSCLRLVVTYTVKLIGPSIGSDCLHALIVGTKGSVLIDVIPDATTRVDETDVGLITQVDLHATAAQFRSVEIMVSEETYTFPISRCNNISGVSICTFFANTVSVVPQTVNYLCHPSSPHAHAPEPKMGNFLGYFMTVEVSPA